MFVRLTTSLAISPTRVTSNQKTSWRPGDKYECSEQEGKLRCERGEAVPYIDGEADYIPPDGVDAHVIVNKTVRDQGTVVQPKPAKRQPATV